MAHRDEFEPLYETFSRFVDRCLLADGSLLWPEKKIWTIDQLKDIKNRLVENPIYGVDMNFQEKFELQMEGAPQELWALFADLFYVYLLPSSYITMETKKEYVRWAAQKSGRPLSMDDPDIWKPQKAGFTRTSYHYHMKAPQFRLLIELSLHIKEHPEPEELMRSPQRLQETIDNILEDIPEQKERAFDMRHAILYLSFPDHYERIISTRDKERIVDYYQEQVDGSLPQDIDKALRRVRDSVVENYDFNPKQFDFYNDLKHDWRPGKKEETKGESNGSNGSNGEKISTLEIDDVSNVLAVMKHIRNIILYGPPGTGKTYIAKKVASYSIQDQLKQGLSESALVQRVIDGLSFHDVLATSMYQEDPQGNFSVPELEGQKLVQVRFRTSPVKNPKNYIWGYLQSHTDPESQTVKGARRHAPYLFDKDDHSRWYLTDVGREYVEESLSDRLEQLTKTRPKELKPEDFIEWVTFHQSYSYEDFVEGLRPIVSEEQVGEISYDIVQGVFRRICSKASQDPDNDYFLVIDEINRGNIAKIMGELITLIEDDKRTGASNELTITLPYSGDKFTVPSNLFIFGTMNTADRSIALFDVALRRRFAFVEIMPRAELLDGHVVDYEGTTIQLDALLNHLNKDILRLIDRDHQIGHSYFLKVGKAPEENRMDVLEFVWNSQILPLMEEYFYSQRDQLASILKPFQIEGAKEVGTVDGEDHSFEISRESGEDLILALADLIESKISD
jgi:5-methylcytosine-specific restriction protein B